MSSAKPTSRKVNQRNYYRVLFVQPDAPMEIIRASYRTIMQKLKAHPDLGGDTWNASVINDAYQTLSNARRRRAYDDELFADKELSELGLQHHAQRYADVKASTDAEIFSGTWESFAHNACSSRFA